jgi:hypothetical protein
LGFLETKSPDFIKTKLPGGNEMKKVMEFDNEDGTLRPEKEIRDEIERRRGDNYQVWIKDKDLEDAGSPKWIELQDKRFSLIREMFQASNNKDRAKEKKIRNKLYNIDNQIEELRAPDDGLRFVCSVRNDDVEAKRPRIRKGNRTIMDWRRSLRKEFINIFGYSVIEGDSNLEDVDQYEAAHLKYGLKEPDILDEGFDKKMIINTNGKVEIIEWNDGSDSEG